MIVCLILINPKSFERNCFYTAIAFTGNDCLNLPVVGFSQRKPSIPAIPTSFDLNLNKPLRLFL
jgi:hypothetical protein